MNNFTVTQDNQDVTDEYRKQYEPSIAQKLVERSRIELLSVSYDLCHFTNYTLIRHRLLAQKRREAHLSRIGLVRTTS